MLFALKPLNKLKYTKSDNLIDLEENKIYFLYQVHRTINFQLKFLKYS